VPNDGGVSTFPQFIITDHVNKTVEKEHPWFNPLNKEHFSNNNNSPFSKTIVCTNCRKKGHPQRQCLKPINSYGIIALRKLFKEPIKVLMIRRLHSIGFETFLRGRYRSNQEMQSLIDRMTSEEKKKIISMTFDELWDDICVNQNSYFYKHGKAKAKEKFDSLNIQKLFENTNSPWIEPSWEFPKGRRQLYESDKECAIREFTEETNYTQDYFRIITRKIFVELYTGTNHVEYKHNYFLAWMNPDAPRAEIDPNNKFQMSEVGDIGWFELDEAIEKIKPYNTEKKKVLQVIQDFVERKHKKKKENKWNALYTPKKILDDK
jgi:8-oxo-dGTP pyrophosphatase MutT (NUDIX family)